MHNLAFKIGICAFVLIGNLHFGVPTRAQDMGFHSAEGHAQLHHWYKHLMRPDAPKLSCCSDRDCTPTQAKLVNGEWWAMKAGRWVKIPVSKINTEGSYDTRPHICWYPWTKDDDDVLCFVKPGAGI